MRILASRLFQGIKGRWTKIQLNDLAKQQFSHEPNNPLLDPFVCQKWVDSLHRDRNVDYSWGGYLEDRKDLWRGHYHQPGHTIHLGIDYNVPIGTIVHMPVKASLVRATIDQDREGGWGGQLIFKSQNTYFIFGHLTNIANKVGSVYNEGDIVGVVAEPDSNGFWYPHLHVQCMRNCDPSVDGYSKNYCGIELDFPRPDIIVKNV